MPGVDRGRQQRGAGVAPAPLRGRFEEPLRAPDRVQSLVELLAERGPVRLAEPGLPLQHAGLVALRRDGQQLVGVAPSLREVSLEERHGGPQPRAPPPARIAQRQVPHGRVAQLQAQLLEPLGEGGRAEPLQRPGALGLVDAGQHRAERLGHPRTPKAELPGPGVGRAGAGQVPEQVEAGAERVAGRAAASRRSQRPQRLDLGPQAGEGGTDVVERGQVLQPHGRVEGLGQRPEPRGLERLDPRAPLHPEPEAERAEQHHQRGRQGAGRGPVPASPPEQPLRGGRRPRQHRLPTLEASQIVGERLGAGVAGAGLLLHGLGHHPAQLDGNLRRQRGRVLVEQPPQQAPGVGRRRLLGAAAEGRAPGQDRVEGGAERVDVGPEVDGPLVEQGLRAHVLERAGREPGARQPRLVAPRQAEVRDQGARRGAAPLHQHVAGLHVPVHQPLPVGGVQSLGGLTQQLDALGEAGAGREDRQRAALHELEHDAGAAAQRAHLEDPHHARVVHARLEPRLEQEPLGLARVGAERELHRHRALQRAVPGAVHLAHAPGAQQPLELHAAVERRGRRVQVTSRSAWPRRTATSSSVGSAKLE